MQVTEVNFTNEEKTKFLDYLKEQKDNAEASISTLDREKGILQKCREMTPPDAPMEWVKSLADRMNEYAERIQYIQDTVDITKKIAKSTTEGKIEMPVKGLFKDILTTLHARESHKKHIEKKYSYYPRLKKAKEQSMYVFANKIKIIMESENVRFA